MKKHYVDHSVRQVALRTLKEGARAELQKESSMKNEREIKADRRRLRQAAGAGEGKGYLSILQSSRNVAGGRKSSGKKEGKYKTQQC